MSKLFDSVLSTVLSLSAFGACASEPPSRWDRDGNTFHAEAGDQVFDLTDDQLELVARPASVPITLRTAGVTRDGVALDTTVFESTPSGRDTIDIAREGFVESIEIHDDRLEQSWRFTTAPGRVGDLTVTIDVGSATGADRVDGGLVLHRAGELDVFYSDATWIDATATQVAVPAVYRDGQIVLVVPAAEMAKAVFPAVLDPQIIVTPIGGGLVPSVAPATASTTRYCTLQSISSGPGHCDLGWRYPWTRKLYRCTDGGWFDQTFLGGGIPCSNNPPQTP